MCRRLGVFLLLAFPKSWTSSLNFKVFSSFQFGEGLLLEWLSFHVEELRRLAHFSSAYSAAILLARVEFS